MFLLGGAGRLIAIYFSQRVAPLPTVHHSRDRDLYLRELRIFWICHCLLCILILQEAGVSKDLVLISYSPTCGWTTSAAAHRRYIAYIGRSKRRAWYMYEVSTITVLGREFKGNPLTETSYLKEREREENLIAFPA